LNHNDKIAELESKLDESLEQAEKIRTELLLARRERNKELLIKLLKHHKFPHRVGWRTNIPSSSDHIIDVEVYDGKIAKDALIDLINSSNATDFADSINIWQCSPVIQIYDPEADNEQN